MSTHIVIDVLTPRPFCHASGAFFPTSFEIAVQVFLSPRKTIQVVVVFVFLLNDHLILFRVSAKSFWLTYSQPCWIWNWSFTPYLTIIFTQFLPIVCKFLLDLILLVHVNFLRKNSRSSIVPHDSHFPWCNIYY